VNARNERASGSNVGQRGSASSFGSRVFARVVKYRCSVAEITRSASPTGIECDEQIRRLEVVATSVGTSWWEFGRHIAPGGAHAGLQRSRIRHARHEAIHKRRIHDRVHQ
jgi:hypothetical protein